jgi:DNA-binding beta-propeller fold protein YncE
MVGGPQTPPPIPFHPHKCRSGRCRGSSGRCGTTVSFNQKWGSTGSGNSQFRTPWGIATDRNGDVYVTDIGNSRVQVFDQNGTFIRKWGTQGNGPDRFQEPRAIAVNQEGSNSGSLRAYVADPSQSNSTHRVRKFRTDGTDLASLGQGGLSNPRGVAVDANNNVWMVDGSSGQIFLFDRSGNLRTSWTPSGSGALSSPEGIAVFEDSDGSTYVYVANRGSHRVIKFEYTGNSSSGLTFVKSAGSQGGGSTSFNEPVGVAADACGNI